MNRKNNRLFGANRKVPKELWCVNDATQRHLSLGIVAATAMQIGKHAKGFGALWGQHFGNPGFVVTVVRLAKSVVL